MADLSKFSTEDLEAMAGGKLGALSDEALQHLHESASQSEPEPTWGDYGRMALTVAGKAANKLDSYTGAPTRAMVGALQNNALDLGGASDAFWKQMGQDPSNAPTGEDIVVRAGVPKGSTAAKVAGFGMDMAANPTSIVPVGEIAGAAVKGIGRAAGIGAKAAQVAAEAAPEVGAIANAAKPGLLSRGAGVTAETLTGVDKKLASNYLSNTDRINGIVSKFSGQEGYSEAAHAADVRAGWRGAIQDTRKAMNDKIGSALESSEVGNQAVSSKPVIHQIDDAIAKANPVTQAQDIATLKGLRAKLGAMSDANGQIPLKDMHAFKKYAFNAAEPAFDGAGNAIFPGGDFAAKQAKGIGGVARDILVKNGPKELGEAEGVLSQLHGAEDTMNSTLLKDNGPVHAIARAGVNPGGVEAKSLQQLGDITGRNFIQDAKDFATARQFAAPKFTPETNGKSLLRAGIGATGGLIANHLLPIVDPQYAALAGAAVTSPGALKAGINAANVVGKAAMVPVRAVSAAPQSIYNAATSPAGRAVMDLGAKSMLTQPAMQVAQSQSDANRTPAKGIDAHVQDGIQRLGIQDQALIERLIQDPKAKQLLLQASDRSLGDKAAKRIMSQIQKGWGGK